MTRIYGYLEECEFELNNLLNRMQKINLFYDEDSDAGKNSKRSRSQTKEANKPK